MTGLSISSAPLPAGDGTCRVIRLAGEADLTDTALREAFAAEVAAGPRLLLVDMTALTFIDSAATQVIIAAHRVLRDEEGATLALIRPTPAVARVLSVLGIDQQIPVYGSICEAAAAGPARLPGKAQAHPCGGRRAVKAALTDQSAIAGLGNLLADEILWRDHVHPRRPVAGAAVDGDNTTASASVPGSRNCR